MSTVPSAWDDDYEPTTDQNTTPGPAKSLPSSSRTTRAERKAQHAEANKALWDSAENPETLHFIETRNNVPLKSEFKPALKVLSRKPQSSNQTTQNSTKTLANRMADVTLDDDDPDSEEEARRQREKDLATRQAKAKQEREEKQKKYQEVRERLFGSPAPASDSNPALSSPSKGSASTRGKNQRGQRRDGASRSQPTSSTDQSPARPASHSGKQLYDPNYDVKPTSAQAQSRSPNLNGDLRQESRAESQTFRSPRGPDGSGRGGFGFAPRGNKLNGG